MAYQPMTMSNAKPKEEREENDFYATHPSATKTFLNEFNKHFNPPQIFWENACGNGHIGKVLEDTFPLAKIHNTDIIQRQFPCKQLDFLTATKADRPKEFTYIITNPPFKLAEQFVWKAMDLLNDGEVCAYLLRIQFYESKSRKELFEKFPPKFIFAHSERQQLSKNGDFDKYTTGTQFFAWFVWEKGYKDDTIIKRI